MLEVRDASFRKDGIKYRNVRFSLSAGEAVALIAPNGAGKTTLMRTVAGDAVADAQAVVAVDSAVVARRSKAARASVFYADSEHRLLYPAKTCAWHLACVKEIWNSPCDLEQIAKQCAVAPFIDKRVSQLSKGMAQRLTLTLACMSGAPYVLLDEPDNGMDDDGRKLLSEVAQGLLERGCGLLVSTHDIFSISRICTRALFLTREGCVAAADCADSSGLHAAYRKLFL